MLNKFYQLVTALYPGGYRFLAIFLIGYMYPAQTSSDFSQYFFWAALISTVAGIPIASRAQAKGETLSHKLQFLLCFAFTVICIPITWIFWQDTFIEFCAMIFAASILSVFEIKRVERAVEGHFQLLTICSLISLAALLVITLVVTLPATWLIVAIFSGLAAPVVLSYCVHGHTVSSPLAFKPALKLITAHALSSLLITGLAFVIPLILIEEFGHAQANDIARVFAISSIVFSYPRYLSTGFVVQAKKGLATLDTVKSLARNIFIFAMCTSAIYAIVTWFIAPQLFTYTVLFIAMQFSQVCLPYGNWWITHSHETSSMKLNFNCVLALALAVGCILLLFPQGADRGQIILLIYLGFHILRFLIYSKSKLNTQY